MESDAQDRDALATVQTCSAESHHYTSGGKTSFESATKNSCDPWDNCIICGKGDGELKCPAQKTLSEGLATYGEFVDNVLEFQGIGKLPVDLFLFKDCTDAELLFSNCAKWHKSCHLKFARSKLERARKILKRRSLTNTSNEEPGDKSKRQRLTQQHLNSKCIFCLSDEGTLHKCSTLSLDQVLRNMATVLQDTSLLSRLAGGDLIAIDAKYHNRCLTCYKNKYRAYERSKHHSTSHNSEQMTFSQVFAELVLYMETNVEDGEYIFKLSDLHKLYTDKLSMLGYTKSINKSRLKDSILNHFCGNCQEQTIGRNTLLIFQDGMREILKESMQKHDFEQEALHRAKVANIVRNDMLYGDFFNFSGSFPDGCENDSVPHSLKLIVSTLLYGTNIQSDNRINSRECLTICQLILFNCKGKTTESKKARHVKKREPPLPLYIGIDVHTRTRNQTLISHLSDFGISVSYSRVLEVEDWLTNAVCQRYSEESLVCPSQIRNEIFTVGALDNLDHNPTSTSAQGSFHGTSISVFQFPTAANPGSARETITVPPPDGSTSSLPDDYIIVPAVSCNISKLSPPEVQTTDISGCLQQAQGEEKAWIDKTIPLLCKEKLENNDSIAWGAYHASQQSTTEVEPGVTALLPLFQEKAASVAMVKHGMGILKKITLHCNPGQTPVMAVDQPLFALAKYVQWCWPSVFGEEIFTVMLGGLHTEIALWKTAGNLLEDSGWTQALTDAGVATSGSAESFLSVSHVKRTRNAHQITALTLARLQRDAFAAIGNGVTFEEWREEMLKKSPVFMFWDLILHLELLILIFVRSHRERNFQLYVEVMEALVPWFFALDHTNYARWLSVHIRDMKSLLKEPCVDFQRNWVFPKTGRSFSTMPLDQAHEQNNRTVKESGGAVGLTENPSAFRRWMVSGPEQARLLQEFEKQQDPAEHRNHQQGGTTQQVFQANINKLTDTINAMGNPFLEECDELMTLDTHDCVGDPVVKSITNLEKQGKQQYETYVREVFVTRRQSIHAPIKKNQALLFKRPECKVTSKTKQQMSDLKDDYSLFTQMFIASQVRQADLIQFFCHENHPWPPALSQHGNLRLPTCKSELLDCLKFTVPDDRLELDAKIYDGAAIVHSLPTVNVSSFGDYSDFVFIPWLERQLSDCSRVDIVWDQYNKGSLKSATREKRGKGARRKVSGQTKIPSNFPMFLKDTKNKQELFELLTDAVQDNEFETGKEVHITSGGSVLCRGGESALQSDHEEADTRLALHVKDAVSNGSNNILVNTVDTDVLVILVGVFAELREIENQLQLRVSIGKGKNLKIYSVNSIHQELGDNIAVALPFFHAFSGCDTTSQFSGKGKKTSWKTWQAYPDVTNAFAFPSRSPFQPIDIESEEFALIERFVCIMYDHTTPLHRVNDVRQDMFCQGKRTKMMHLLPPTQNALLQHTNRALFQASIWTQSLVAEQRPPSPDNFGWYFKEEHWHPRWLTVSEMSKSCRELIKCGCKAQPVCSRKCICRHSQLQCTSLCSCKGLCEN